MHAAGSPLSTTTEQLRAAHRSGRLNLLNHPLQIQLATGALPYGSFVRLCHDRSTILEAVRSALAAAGANVLSDAKRQRRKPGSTRPKRRARPSAPAIRPSSAARAAATTSTSTAPALCRHGARPRWRRCCGRTAVPRRQRRPRGLRVPLACDTLLKAGFEHAVRGLAASPRRAPRRRRRPPPPVRRGRPRRRRRFVRGGALRLFNFVDSEASTAGLKGAGEDLEAARRARPPSSRAFLEATGPQRVQCRGDAQGAGRGCCAWRERWTRRAVRGQKAKAGATLWCAKPPRRCGTHVDGALSVPLRRRCRRARERKVVAGRDASTRTRARPPAAQVPRIQHSALIANYDTSERVNTRPAAASRAQIVQACRRELRQSHAPTGRP